MTLAKYKILQKLISRTLTFLCGHRKIVDIFIKYYYFTVMVTIVNGFVIITIFKDHKKNL